MGFSIGIVSFVAALFGVFLVYGNFWGRSFIAWYRKTEPPRDRVRFGACSAAVFFIIGSVLQPQFDKIGACTDSGYTLGQCILRLHH